MTSLALLRHGPTLWSEEHRLQGRADLSLSDAGRARVERWRLPVLCLDRRWVASPLRRCRETGEILAATHDRPAPAIEPRLIEMSHGEWEGLQLDELRARFGAAMAAREAQGLDYRSEGGESPRELQARLLPWLRAAAEAGEPLLAIAHKGVLRALYALATGWDMVAEPQEKLANDAVHLFRLEPGGGLAVDRLNLPLLEPSSTR